MARKTLSADDVKVLRDAAERGLLTDTFRGRGIAITGTCSMKRDDIVKLIMAVGGRFDERVRWQSTRYLIVGDTGRHGFTNKQREAANRGVRVITETDFVDMLKVTS